MKRIGIWFLIIFLWGCSQPQKALIPTPTIPQQFPSGKNTTPVSKNIAHLAWWKQFKDPNLNQLIQQSLCRNPDIHIAVARLKEAQGELKQVKLGWIPTLKLFAGYSTNPALGTPGGFYGAWPYYAINIIHQLKRQKQAKFQVDYQNALIDGVKLMVIGQTASAYFTLMAQREERRLLKTLDQDLNTLIRLTQKDIEIGLENEIDIAKLKVDEQLLSASIKPVEHNIVVSQNALRFLLNQNPGDIKTASNFLSLDFVQFKPGSLPATVLCNRPDFKMATFALKREQAGVAMAWANFLPSLQLDEFVGEAHLPHSTLAEVTDSYVQADLALSTFGKLSARKGAEAGRMADYIKTVRQILKEVDDDLSANEKMRVFYQTKQKAQETYANQFKLQQGLFKTGLISYKMLLENKIYLTQLALETNQAQLRLALSLVTLYQDLAGGYKA